MLCARIKVCWSNRERDRVRYNPVTSRQSGAGWTSSERPQVRGISFGARGTTCDFQLTQSATAQPEQADNWFIMTHLPGEILRLPGLSTLRTGIESGFKPVKHELGWADFRLSEDSRIERWWEVILSADCWVSLPAPLFQLNSTEAQAAECRLDAPVGCSPSARGSANDLEEYFEQLALTATAGFGLECFGAGGRYLPLDA